MTIRSLKEAKDQLEQLITLAEGGEEVRISREGGSDIQLVVVSRPKGKRTLGLLTGKLEISEDFDELDATITELVEKS